MPEPVFASLLAKYVTSGGVLDYVYVEVDEDETSDPLHRATALFGMTVIDQRLKNRAVSLASDQDSIETFFRLEWDPSKPLGKRVSFAEFWGTDDVEPKPLRHRAWSIPDIDGYKPAFFHPPYGLRGSEGDKLELFSAMNTYIFGDNPSDAEIVSWSTDWSTYFEAGHEWWGAYYWTIRPEGSDRNWVIAASSTD